MITDKEMDVAIDRKYVFLKTEQEEFLGKEVQVLYSLTNDTFAMLPGFICPNNNDRVHPLQILSEIQI